MSCSYNFFLLWWESLKSTLESESVSHFSYVRLCNLIGSSSPDSSVRGILQARILEWVAIPFSRGSSWPRDRTWVSYRQILYHLSHQGSWRSTLTNFQIFSPRTVTMLYIISLELSHFITGTLYLWATFKQIHHASSPNLDSGFSYQKKIAREQE